MIQTNDVIVELCESDETDLEGCGAVKRTELWNVRRREACLHRKLKNQSRRCANQVLVLSVIGSTSYKASLSAQNSVGQNADDNKLCCTLSCNIFIKTLFCENMFHRRGSGC